jgi:polyisoprenyl-phosphate glycosyltransferase
MKKLITIIAPMYNEESVVYKYTEVTLNALTVLENKYDYEILFVHDGAKDDTLEKMSDMQNKYSDVIGIINLSRNFGLEGAIHAGLSFAKGDAVVVMDADLQDPPSLIPEMVKKWEGGADIVVASRVARTKDNFFKKITANIYYIILDFLSGKLKLEKNAANYRLLSRKAVEKLKELPEVNTYFRVNVPFIGMKTDKVEYDRNERIAGKTNYNFASLIRCALDGLTSISIEPLRKIMYAVPLTFIIILISILGMIFTDGIYFTFLLLLFIISTLFLILFVSLAVMAEYIGQIMLETRHRPTSIVYEYKPSKNAEKK